MFIFITPNCWDSLILVLVGPSAEVSVCSGLGCSSPRAGTCSAVLDRGTSTLAAEHPAYDTPGVCLCVRCP